MQITQVNYQDVLGGAERMAYDIHTALGQHGHHSTLYVSKKKSDDANIIELDPDTDHALLAQFFIDLARLLEGRKKNRFTHYGSKMLRAAASPAAFLRWWRGEEEFNFAKTRYLLENSHNSAQILHLHNLHGGYFDLRLLPRLCDKQPVTITLHDEWMFTGHCGYASACMNWETGCGNCPDLESYPAIRVDNTRHNLQQKRDIYKQCRFYVTTPSQWLMDRVQRSVLADSIIDSRVINNGVDTSIFHPAGKDTVRARLDIDKDAFVGLFIANYFKTSRAKDFKTIDEAVRKLAQANSHRKVILIAIGEDLGTDNVENLEIRTLPYMDDRSILACYYQAADVYLHAAFTEIWGLTVTEAMACGVPVVATATGGVPEQVRLLPGYGITKHEGATAEEATGVLVEEGNSQQMCEALTLLIDDQSLRAQLGANASAVAGENFGSAKMLKQYLDWYADIIDRSCT